MTYPTENLGPRWAEGAFVYQIYPRSFQDSNGDGVGDLPGIIDRLDHVQQLGATAIWLSPFYPSPMADFGYDVADYCDVDPVFGTLDDFSRLLDAAHARDLRVMIDLVPNHTSDEHAWFKQSRRSAAADNLYHDWYIWRDGLPAGGATRPAPPNNWRDVLTGGPAWEWSEERGQYYLHSFHTKQPDLNWSNPAVRSAIKDVMRFWLDKGVDGFRVDAVYWMAKEPLLSDDPPNPDYVAGEDPPYQALRHTNSRGWPAVYAYLSEMAEVLQEPPYRERQPFMVTEAYPEGHNPLAEYLNFYVSIDPHVAAPFNFEGLGMPWEAGVWRKFLRSFCSALAQLDPACVPSYAFGNHDQPRIASRLGEQSARAAAVLLLTLPGMSFGYYGDEIGMKNVPVPPGMVQDPSAKGMTGRDPERTPMQWTAGRHADFTSGEQPWLPIADDYHMYNVEREADDPPSMLSLYRALGKLRKSSSALRHGRPELVETKQPEVLGYICHAASGPAGLDKSDNNYITLVNFSDNTCECTLSHNFSSVIISTMAAVDAPRSASGRSITLGPHEAVVLEAA